MKLLLKVLASLALLLVVLALYLTLSHQPESFPAGSESEARLAAGPWSVASFDESFVDRDRPTQPNGDYPGDDQRLLEGNVWHPFEAEAGPRPLLVFSHGFTSGRRNGTYLAEHLASHGFVVVAVDYPLTSMGAPGGALVEDVINQPGDISFLIDTLLGYSAVSGHALSGKIDAERVGVLGISLGGLTSTLAGFHPEWRDPRIAAVLSIAGPTNFFTRKFFGNVDVPFMMFAGDLDVLVPYASNAAPVLGKKPGAELATVKGGSHTGFSGGTALLRAMDNTDALGCWSVGRYIEADDASQWEGLFGPKELGIDYSAPNELCIVDPLPKAMNVLRQQMIARVVITAFFEQHLAEDDLVSEAAAQFLGSTSLTEIPELDYAKSTPRETSGIPADS
ncbi:alpha/beta hydrolase family protein [Congregibacter sp.]|uniref:alpha/beta hydrolase family protein n=1 Tax=Congregibacter sp. TaxID=2744308 RepID=UPI003F6D41B2